MKHYNSIIIVGIILFTQSLIAQNEIDKGEKYYETYAYNNCIETFEGLKIKTFDVKKKLAESYYKTGNYEKAEVYYKEIVNSDSCTTRDLYDYASILKTNGKYNDSEIWMEKYSKIEKADSRSKQFKQNKDLYNKLYTNQNQFIIKNLLLNNEQQDFGATYYQDKIVFTSSRPNAKYFKHVWNWNNLSFLDLYVAENDSSDLINIQPFTNNINKKYHEGPASFTKDGNFMAFTRNNYSGKSKDEIVKLQIFTSTKVEGQWKEAVPVNFNSKEYSVGQPSLSPDGKTMYFASSMPGGFGGVDIYVVEKDENAIWSTPKNLGKEINTEGDEMFPFIHETGMLFFASNGLFGIGGLDVFFTKMIEGKFVKPKNIGTPINSSYDDFAMIFDDEMKSGFFSSNRKNGKGNDDIYSFKLLENLEFDKNITGKMLDKQGNVIANTSFNLINNKGNIVRTVTSDENGEYNIDVKADEVYQLTTNNNDLYSDSITIDTHYQEIEIQKDIVIGNSSNFKILCKITDIDDLHNINDVNITAINNKLNIKNTYTSNKDGNFLIEIENIGLNDSVSYTFELRKQDYITKKVNIDTLLNKPGELLLNIKMDKLVKGNDLLKSFGIQPIYFEFDKYDITNSAQTELNKVVQVMNDYPGMVVEIFSYTDCRGASIYNLKLSDKRAKESAHYIKTRISNPLRISGRGYGEANLINDCGCEGNKGTGINCSEEEHLKNRRTEFKIIKIE